MAPSRAHCVYFDCNRSRARHPDLSFFRFPINEQQRDKWIINCGNFNLTCLSVAQLREKTICSVHFVDGDFRNKLKNSLVHDAVPVHYDKGPQTECIEERKAEDEISSPVKLTLKRESNLKTYENRKLTDNNSVRNLFEESPSPPRDELLAKFDMPTPKKRKRVVSVSLAKCTNRIQYLQKRLNAKDACIYRLKKKLLANSSVDETTSLLPSVVRIFVNMQLHHKYKHQWSKDEKQVALSLYYKSPTLYMFMRKSLKFTLPSKSTITSCLRMTQLTTGTDTKLFQKLTDKVKTMTVQERQCVLLIDEMSIKKGVEYNPQQDLIEGFEDLGHLGRENKTATQALVFMARGLINKWKIPISYYLSGTSVKHQSLRNLISHNIETLTGSGLNIRALVCDQAATNRAVFQNLGVSECKPFFNVDGKKVYVIFDVPHLFKSVRNNLMAQDIYINEMRTSWEDIKITYYIDKASTTARALPKISETHVNPNTFQKMRVKYATQVFSRTMSAAITTCVNTGQIRSGSARNTAEFILRVNNLFDIMNSRTLNNPNPYLCALSIRRPELEATLLEMMEWVSSWKCYNSKNELKEGIHCFRGLRQSIQGILSLWKDLKEEGYEFLLTSRLNQDPLENLFATIRRRSGNNVNPTAKSFRQSLQWNMLVRLLKPPENSNCEVDDDDVIEIDEVKSDLDIDEECEIPLIVEDTINITESIKEVPIKYQQCDISSTTKNVALEDCAIVYLAGYVV